MSDGNMNLTLKVWRQKNASTKGAFVTYKAEGISPDMSFLEMLDVVNEGVMHSGEEPIHFDHDCREGICGMCSLYINGRPHGPKDAITTCQLHMRSFHDGEIIVIEPWRAAAFPVIKDLAVDRSAFDRIQQAGGFVSVNTGVTIDANEIPIPKVIADEAFNSATCIGCGACVAAVCIGQGIATGYAAAGPAGTLEPCTIYGSANGCRRLWQLHQYRRLRSRMS
jgi:succinate dehydrogenase / fumarate reductase iron-sulfur subunit